MIIGLFAIPISFSFDDHADTKALNEQFGYLEAAFGGAFGIIMSYLFDYGRDDGPMPYQANE